MIKNLKERQRIQLDYETEMFSSKRFRKVQGFLRSVQKAQPYLCKMFHGHKRATDNFNKAELFHQVFNNVFSSKTKNTHLQLPKIFIT